MGWDVLCCLLLVTYHTGVTVSSPAADLPAGISAFQDSELAPLDLQQPKSFAQLPQPVSESQIEGNDAPSRSEVLRPALPVLTRPKRSPQPRDLVDVEPHVAVLRRNSAEAQRRAAELERNVYARLHSPRNHEQPCYSCSEHQVPDHWPDHRSESQKNFEESQRNAQNSRRNYQNSRRNYQNARRNYQNSRQW